MLIVVQPSYHQPTLDSLLRIPVKTTTNRLFQGKEIYEGGFREMELKVVIFKYGNEEHGHYSGIYQING